MIGVKPVRVRFDKANGLVRVYNGTRYLVLFGSEKYDAIYNSIRYFISQKSCIRYVISDNYARIKIDLYNSLSVEKTLTLNNVIILIKPIFNKYQNHHYYNIFSEKYLYQLPKNNDNK